MNTKLSLNGKLIKLLHDHLHYDTVKVSRGIIIRAYYPFWSIGRQPAISKHLGPGLFSPAGFRPYSWSRSRSLPMLHHPA